MCGIVAQWGARVDKKSMVRAMRTLAYRGYDSAGIAWHKDNGELAVVKAVGSLDALEQALGAQKLATTVAMGHTRWATHGQATKKNAHPHLSSDRRVAVVHNGVLEQCAALRAQLHESGHMFHSDTDSELIAHLTQDLLAVHNNDVRTVLCELLKQLHGSYAVVLIDATRPNQLAFVRRESPLIIGYTVDGVMLASDQAAFGAEVTRTVVAPNNCFGTVSDEGVQLFDSQNRPIQFQPAVCERRQAAASKGKFAHYMLKEMYEQPAAIAATVAALRNTPFIWPAAVTRIHLIAAGSSWHAARIAQFFFEEVAQVATRVHLASEFSYMRFFPEPQAIYFFISQSGETADTLTALRRVAAHQLTTVAITNVAHSSLAREAGSTILMKAGPEIAVASTKAFSSQIATLYVLAHQLAQQVGRVPPSAVDEAITQLTHVGVVLSHSMMRYEQEMRVEHAPRYAQCNRMIFLGRHITYPFALEGALKIKEISYIFAQCYPAGELKHGPLALVDAQVPVLLFSLLDAVLYEKIVLNAQEVVARGGRLIVCAFAGQDELISLAETAFIVPPVAPLLAPLALTGIMQLFAYTITCTLGHTIDTPRNLAKSVTVE